MNVLLVPAHPGFPGQILQSRKTVVVVVVVVLLHISYKKNDISGSFTFHKSKLLIIYISVLPNSVFEDPFHHFHSMFQQLNFSVRSTLLSIPFPFVS